MGSNEPTMTYGPWLPTCYLRQDHRIPGSPRLQQKMRRRVKRNWYGGGSSKTYEYEWQDLTSWHGDM